MAVAGNSYIVEIKEAHLNWGTHRYTNSRGIVYGERYIQIPKQHARSFNIYNNNFQSDDILGINVFNCSSTDGFLHNVELKACGSSSAGDIYAKQFQGNGSLQTIGAWYNYIGAQVGDHVEVTWTSPYDIVIRHF